jgi:hypothetical protein
MDSFNKFHSVLKPIALFNTHFYEKILDKYRKNKKINSRFPILFLYKSRCHKDPQKINVSLYWLLELKNNFTCTLKICEKTVRNCICTGKQPLMLLSGKTALNLQMEDPKNVQEGIGKRKGEYFSFSREGSIRLLNKNKFLGTHESNSFHKSVMLTTVSKYWNGIGSRIALISFERIIPTIKSSNSSANKNLPEIDLLLKKIKFFKANEDFSKKICWDRRVIYSLLSCLKVYPALENLYKSDDIPETGSILSQVYPYLTISKVWTGIGNRKAFTASERVVPTVKSVIRSAKKHAMLVKINVPEANKTEGSIVRSPFPMMDTINLEVKASVPDILPGLEADAYEVKVKSFKNLPEIDLLFKKMKLFKANEDFSKEISWNRRVHNSLLSRLKFYSALQNRYKCDYISNVGPSFSQTYPQLSGINELHSQTVKDLYFFNQRQIDQEIQKIKESMSGLEKSVSEKMINFSFPEKASAKSAQEISIISERVYQSIERRIKMEKEMRGM